MDFGRAIKKAVITHTLPPPPPTLSCSDGKVSSDTRADQTAAESRYSLQIIRGGCSHKAPMQTGTLCEDGGIDGEKDGKKEGRKEGAKRGRKGQRTPVGMKARITHTFTFTSRLLLKMTVFCQECINTKLI